MLNVWAGADEHPEHRSYRAVSMNQDRTSYSACFYRVETAVR